MNLPGIDRGIGYAATANLDIQTHSLLDSYAAGKDVSVKLRILGKPGGIIWLLWREVTRRNRWSEDHGNQADIGVTNSAAPVGKLLSYIFYGPCEPLLTNSFKCH